MGMRLLFLNLSIFAFNCAQRKFILISQQFYLHSFKELQISFFKAFNHIKFYRSSYFAFNDLSSSILWREYRFTVHP